MLATANSAREGKCTSQELRGPARPFPAKTRTSQRTTAAARERPPALAQRTQRPTPRGRGGRLHALTPSHAVENYFQKHGFCFVMKLLDLEKCFSGHKIRAGSRERGVKFYSIEHVADTLSTGEPGPRPMPPVSRRHVPDGRSGRAGLRPRKPLTAHGHDRRWSRGPRDSQDHSAPRLPSKQHSAR